MKKKDKQNNQKIGVLIGALVFTLYLFRAELFPTLIDEDLQEDEQITLLDINYIPFNNKVDLAKVSLEIYTPQKEAGFDRKEITLDELIQENTIIHLWATWCNPCMVELPKYNTAVGKHKHVEHIAIITGKADVAEALKLLNDKGLSNIKIIVDKKATISQLFDIRGIPATIFFKKKKPTGVIAGGINWIDPEVENLIYKRLYS